MNRFQHLALVWQKNSNALLGDPRENRGKNRGKKTLKPCWVTLVRSTILNRIGSFKSRFCLTSNCRSLCRLLRARKEFNRLSRLNCHFLLLCSTDIKAMSLLLIKSKVRRESYKDIQLTIFTDSKCYFLPMLLIFSCL